MTNYFFLGALASRGGAWLTSLLLSAGLLACASHHASGDATLIITQGGTYSGTYRSHRSDLACVRIATREPVVLSGCQLSGPGNLIEAAEGANITVRDCRGQGLPPTLDKQPPGRFLDAYRPQHLVVEHNLLTQTSGININRWAEGGGQLLVRYNQARNIDGRWHNNQGSTHVSFLLLNTVQHLPGVEVAYNEVLNEPNKSLVEDNINLYNSSGTASSPIRVHDNFVRGAYPYPATAAAFTGSGLTTDGDGRTAEQVTAFVEADHNQLVATGNAGLNIAAGHDIYFHDNHVVTCGLLPDGQRFVAPYAGLGLFNFYKQPETVFFNNRMSANTVGFVHWGGSSPYPDRQDLSPDHCATCTGTIHLPNPVTLATEAAEWVAWQQKLRQARLLAGPRPASQRSNN